MKKKLTQKEICVKTPIKPNKPKPKNHHDYHWVNPFVVHGHWRKLVRRTKDNKIIKLEKTIKQLKIRNIGGDEMVYLQPAGASQNPMYIIRFAIVEIKDLITSHRSLEGFIKDNRYNQSIQDRDYTKQAEQDKVVDIASKLQPEYMLSLAVTAAEGSPIINYEGIVLSGNGRTMALNYTTKHFPKQYETYRNKLKSKIKSYGFIESDVNNYKYPILVRVANIKTESKQASEFGRSANSKVGAARSELREASYLAEIIPSELFYQISEADESNLSDIINQRHFVKFLMNAIPIKEHQAIFTDNQFLTDTGKSLVKKILLIKCLGNADTIENMTPRHYRLFESVIPKLVDIRQLEAKGTISSKYSMSGMIAESISFYGKNIVKDNFANYKEFCQQKTFSFKEKPLPSKHIHSFLLALELFDEHPRQFNRFIELLKKEAKAESSFTSGILKIKEKEFDIIIDECVKKTFIKTEKEKELTLLPTRRK